MFKPKCYNYTYLPFECNTKIEAFNEFKAQTQLEYTDLISITDIVLFSQLQFLCNNTVPLILFIKQDDTSFGIVLEHDVYIVCAHINVHTYTTVYTSIYFKSIQILLLHIGQNIRIFMNDIVCVCIFVCLINLNIV